jgi:DNA polymerase mu
MEDMERYYDVPTGGAPSAIQEEETLTPNGRRVPRTALLPDISIQVGLCLRHDLEAKIPRAEVEEIHAVVMSELGELQEGCVGMIVGGWVEYLSCHWTPL